MKRVSIRGDIIRSSNKWIYDWLGMDATCPGDVTKVLDEAAGEEIEVDINSGGGDISAGSEIYTLLRRYPGKITINILGLAASAASVIAMAGRSRISPTALFMIHNTSTGARGDHRTFEDTAMMLREADQAIANAYKEKTGFTDEELLQYMDQETWMNADRAVNLRFVDEIMFQSEQMSIYNSTSILKDDVIKKIQGLVRMPNGTSDQTAFLNAKFNYLMKVRKQ